MPSSVVALVEETPFNRIRRATVGTVVQAGTRPVLNGRIPIVARRRLLGLAGRVATPLPKSVRVDVVDLDGIRTWRMTPPDAPEGADLFVLHGGGYNYGGLDTHRAYAHLALMAGMTAWMPDYRLVPDNPPEAPLQDALRSWSSLVQERPDGRRFVTGDSAGAGLSLALAVALRDGGGTTPDGLALHSPWVDAAASKLAGRPSDRILHRGVMAVDRDLWVGDRDDRDPAVSPLRNDLRGLPPMFVQWGEREGLHRDAEALVAAVDASDGDVVGEAYAHLWHDAMLHVPALPDAVAWLRRTADTLRRWADD